MVTLRVVAGVAVVAISIMAPASGAGAESLRVDFTGALFAQAPPDGSEAALQTATAGPKPKFGEKDSWRWMLQVGGAFEVRDSDNRFMLLGGGVSYFITDDLSLDLELNGMYFDQNGDDASGVNIALLLRWHFVARDTWSIYLDGGAGVLETTRKVPGSSPQEPDGGSRFNFTPQAGGGFTLALDEHTRFFAGIRWYHISNAQLFEDNPGRDHIYLYAGVSLPF